MAVLARARLASDVTGSKMRQSRVGDGGVREIEVRQFRTGFEVREVGIGQPHAAEVEEPKVRQPSQNRQSGAGDFRPC